MRVILVVEQDQTEREILVDECDGVGLIITINDPYEACSILQTLKFDLAIVGVGRLEEPSFSTFFAALKLTAPHTRLLSLPLASCPP